jgi:hypothetical protein
VARFEWIVKKSREQQATSNKQQATSKKYSNSKTKQLSHEETTSTEKHLAEQTNPDV